MPEGEKIGGASSKGRAESTPLIGMELTDMPNIWGASGPTGTQSDRKNFLFRKLLRGVFTMSMVYCLHN